MRYRVYCNNIIENILIHDTYIPDASMHLIEPKCKLGDNIAGSFEFKVPPSNPGYNAIKRLTSTIVLYEDNEIIWTGRVVSESEDFWKRRSFTCEGALAYLNDTYTNIAQYHSITMDAFLITLINGHNNRVTNNYRKFSIGTINMDDPESNFEYETNNESTWETISKTFVDRLGGHVILRYSSDSPIPIFDYYRDYPDTSGQEINFGINLLDFTKDWDMSDIATVILPRGKQIEAEEGEQKTYVTIKSVNDGSEYLKNNTAYNTYGRIERIVDFSDVEDPAILLKMGRAYLRGMQFDTMTLNVSAVDLHHLNPSIDKFSLLDVVHCISKPHGLDKSFPITEKEIDINSPSNTKYTMGTSNSGSLSSVSSAESIKAKDRIFNTASDILSLAKSQASAYLNSYTRGYVNIVQENDVSQALIISNMPDYFNKNASLWKFDMRGLGYSPNADENGNRNYTLAIMSNGTIVADFIKTGILSDGGGVNGSAKNWWNLSTGEFSLNYNVKLKDQNNNDKGSIKDVYELAHTASDDADAATSKANATADKLNKQSIGSTNLLDGTNDWDGWAKYGGKFRFSGDQAICDKPPNTNVSQFIQSKSRQLAYSSIKGTVCTLHFEARSADAWGARSATNKVVLKFILKKHNTNGTITNVAAFTREFDLTTYWVRKATTATFQDSTFSKLTNGIAYTDCHIYVEIFNVSKHQIFIRKIKFERGNVITDWAPSPGDYNRQSTVKANKALIDSKVYVNSISQKDREFSTSQRKALDASLTQANVLKRLTNNYRSKGIYLSKNQLYINATYIKTGTLDAGIVKAGILTNKKQTFYWNLATGYIKSKNMELSNMNATGTITSTSGKSKISVKGGKVNFYSLENKKWPINGYIFSTQLRSKLAGSSGNYGPGMGKSLVIHSEKALLLSTAGLYVSTAKKGVYKRGSSSSVAFNYMAPNGRVGAMVLSFQNGLFVGYSHFNGAQFALEPDFGIAMQY